MAARMPTMAATTITSSSVNPCTRLNFMRLPLPIGRAQCKRLNFREKVRLTDGPATATGVGLVVANAQWAARPAEASRVNDFVSGVACRQSTVGVDDRRPPSHVPGDVM